MHGHGVLAHWAPEEGVVVYEVPGRFDKMQMAKRQRTDLILH